MASSLILEATSGCWYGWRYSRGFIWYIRPSDIEIPLACAPFQVDSAGNDMTLTFRPKYIGRHTFRVFLQEPPRIASILAAAPPVTFETELAVYRGDSLVVARVQRGPSWSVLRSGSTEEGSFLTDFSLFSLEAPEDVPIGKSMRAAITVRQSDARFAASFGRKDICVANEQVPERWSPPWRNLPPH